MALGDRTTHAGGLRGGAGDDVIKGHGGTDAANGGPGRDSCVAEREKRCER